MSETSKIPLGKNVQALDVSPKFDGYSGVEIVNEDGTSTLVGNTTGRVLTVTGISTSNAQAILTRIRGFRYQPYDASDAILNPAAEIGDGVTVTGLYSGIYRMTKKFSSLMATDISAPQDEELDHEYPYEPKQDRVFKREIQEAYSRITQTENAIDLEVARATEAEGSLSSRITQTASEINATVSKKLNVNGGAASSFGWTLTAQSWELKSNNSTVFKADSSGVEVKGRITATSGYIGNESQGFTITSSSLYNGMNSINSGSNGIYIGTNGIALGGGKFKVTSSGAITAQNMTLTGKLKIGGTDIEAAALRSGAQSAYNWSTNGTTTNWNNGYTYGNNYNNATKNGTSSYPTYFTAANLRATNRCDAVYMTISNTLNAAGTFNVNGLPASWQEVTINGVKIRYLGR